MPKTKPATKSEKAIEPTIMPSEQALVITAPEAKTLDEAIDNRIKSANDSLVQHYLALADDLQRMQVTKGFEYLGFKTWVAYLASKNDFGKSYLSYLLKLAKAGRANLEPLMRPGMSATKLIAYAKATDFPEKIPALIEATWASVEALSVRETSRVVLAYAEGHSDEFRKVKKARKPRARTKGWDAKVQALYERVPEGDQVAFKKALKAWLKGK
jgi:hypothetical protein